MDNTRYDCLFEPLQIGPVTAPNRFYQVPHCNGMGHLRPQSLAAMRSVKAEGGWGVVCTEMMEIHPTSDVTPYLEGRLWDDSDIAGLRLMTDAVHQHGSLAGVELAHSGSSTGNLYSREVPLAPSHTACYDNLPLNARAMDKKDIANFRQWHRQAALRSKAAGFDIIYVYLGHDLTLLQHFLSPRHNRRNDEYGGSLINRVRLLKEVLQDTKEAVGDRCAVACRFAVDELIADGGLRCGDEGREVIEMLADIPDLWDVNISNWSNDSQTSRFAEEGYQEPFTAFVKQITKKPVVGVGRYTSPDKMVSLIKGGMLDMIGAARPSIADPFLPNKIREGRFEDIRECIGCNICVTGDMNSSPIRCTQNPTMGEEWRKDWHPEIIPTKKTDDAVLVVGAGPAGMELAMSLGKRGYQVTVAEASAQLGGRVLQESALPGLTAWKRVADYRELWLRKAPNVELYFDSSLSARELLSFEIPHVYLATGADWRRDGISRSTPFSIEGIDSSTIFTPDDIFAGNMPRGKVTLFDDDNFYMGGVIAEQLVAAGCEVSLVTNDALVSPWTVYTMEQHRIQARLMELGVAIYTQQNLSRVESDHCVLCCIYTGKKQLVDTDSLVMVTEKLPREQLFKTVAAEQAINSDLWQQSGIRTLTTVGDCHAPGTIANAIYSGHLHAREHDENKALAIPFNRELGLIQKSDG
ncbi:FAD-dependent oxidoreductase [SAR92 clade bacterium H921]|jgi:dimethylamine/trimethylamine dehydrogenase|nr:FAD-dependent oxidoreductase [SAR92 clade bacterium H921]MDA9687311.1 FAD-dependent oxidoreductase [bacterium]MDG0971065.1 FAD-dependent oxidoreductase [Porticoccaceae bacterium]MDG1307373.1 FAD-dependent oxidoreductase [Porticoccaceae bacterium]